MGGFVFPIYVTDPAGVVHGFVQGDENLRYRPRRRSGQGRTWCGLECGTWPVIVGGTVDCPDCIAAR